MHLKIRGMKKVIKTIVNEVLGAKAETKKLFWRAHYALRIIGNPVKFKSNTQSQSWIEFVKGCDWL